jgi:pyruvate formate lyase activating enzyme
MPTPPTVLKNARKIALKAGLKYVYTGNIDDDEGSTTFCPKCKKAVIKRKDLFVLENNIKNGRCRFCRAEIAGVWS